MENEIGSAEAGFDIPVFGEIALDDMQVRHVGITLECAAIVGGGQYESDDLKAIPAAAELLEDEATPVARGAGEE